MIGSQSARDPRRLVTLLVPALGLLAACGGGNTSGSTLNACRPLTATAPQRPAGWTGSVFTIVMENQSRGAVIGNMTQAPYINSLAAKYAVANGYHDSYVHPSEPNYIWM
ncbi:MAG TPA: alkaline phosphatase family protein, partial [Polyangia bacterium]|nr:alkaline phosphatase family protein [Polyangia bacterium]